MRTLITVIVTAALSAGITWYVMRDHPPAALAKIEAETREELLVHLDAHPPAHAYDPPAPDR